jgi:hypothetical protein
VLGEVLEDVMGKGEIAWKVDIGTAYGSIWMYLNNI